MKMEFLLITSLLQILLLLVYFKIARKYNIVDLPNNRSSHKVVTIRGGGIIFPISALLWYLYFGLNNSFIIGSLLLISIVSFWDDIKSLSSKVRFLAQIFALGILFWQLQIFHYQWYWVILFFIVAAGWINAFNFMDGINGITAIYGLVTLITIAWLNISLNIVSTELLASLIISLLIFSFYNVRKTAKAFAGDIGSVSLAFLLAWFMLLLIQKTGRIEYILLFSIYGIDSTVTILLRILRKENIFKAHRTHLYQYLSNELECSHVIVALLYGVIQLVVNFYTVKLISLEIMSLPICIITLIILSSIYLIIRSRISSYLRLNFY